MANENPGLRLGDLLTNAGLLKPADLREAMLIARQQQLPVGRVLIMSGYLSEGQLQSAVQAQSMVKDGLIDFEGAIQALNYVATDHVPLEEALNRMGWSQNSAQITNKLGEFLVEAGLVAAPDVQYALGQCQEIGLPLGRVLVVTGYLTEEMLTNALNAQVLVRDRKITRDQARQGLRAALERQISLEESLEEETGGQSISQTSVRLGELFLGASLIDEANLMNAVELGLVNEQLIGQVLRDLDLISAEVLTAALELQSMVAYGNITTAEAVDALFKCHTDQISSYDAVEQLKTTKSVEVEAPPVAPVIEHIPLYQFLQLGGLITQSDIEKAVHAGSKNTEIMGKMLALSGVMSQDLVQAAKQALDLIIKSSINMEQAIIALKNCKSTGNSLASAFTELGWDAGALGLPESHGSSDQGSESAKPTTEAAPRAQGSPLLKTLRAARAHSVSQGQAASTDASADVPSPSFSWSRTSVTPEGGPAAFGEAAVQAAAQAEAQDFEQIPEPTQEEPVPPAAESMPQPSTSGHKSLHEMPSVASGWSMNSELEPNISSVQSKYTPAPGAPLGNVPPVQMPTAETPESVAPAAQASAATDVRRQTGSHQPLRQEQADQANANQGMPSAAQQPLQQPGPGNTPASGAGERWPSGPQQALPLPGTEPTDVRRQTGSHAPFQPPAAGTIPTATNRDRWPSGSQQPLPPVMPGSQPPAAVDPRRQTGSQQALPPMPGSEPATVADPRRQTGSQQPLAPMPGSEPPEHPDQHWQTGSQQPLPPAMPGSQPSTTAGDRWPSASQQSLPTMPGSEPPDLSNQRWQTGAQQPQPTPNNRTPAAPGDRWPSGKQEQLPVPPPGPEAPAHSDQRWQPGVQQPQPMPASEQDQTDSGWPTGSQPSPANVVAVSAPEETADQRWQTGAQNPLPQPALPSPQAIAPSPHQQAPTPPDRWQTQPLNQQPPDNSLAPDQDWQSFPQSPGPQTTQQAAQSGNLPGQESTSWDDNSQSQEPWAPPARAAANQAENFSAQQPGLPEQSIDQSASAPDGMPWQSAGPQPGQTPATAEMPDLPMTEDDQEESQSSRRRKNKLNDLMPKSKSKK
jgi:hypothetical protein